MRMRSKQEKNERRSEKCRTSFITSFNNGAEKTEVKHDPSVYVATGDGRTETVRQDQVFISTH